MDAAIGPGVLPLYDKMMGPEGDCEALGNHLIPGAGGEQPDEAGNQKGAENPLGWAKGVILKPHNNQVHYVGCQGCKNGPFEGLAGFPEWAMVWDGLGTAINDVDDFQGLHVGDSSLLGFGLRDGSFGIICTTKLDT